MGVLPFCVLPCFGAISCKIILLWDAFSRAARRCAGNHFFGGIEFQKQKKFLFHNVQQCFVNGVIDLQNIVDTRCVSRGACVSLQRAQHALNFSSSVFRICARASSS